MPLQIVIVGPFGLRPKGTMSVRALPMAKALVARGHQVTVLIPPWDDTTRAGQSWYEKNVEVVNLPLPPAIPGVFHIWLTYRLYRETLRRKPDVVHLFKPKAYAGLTHLALWLRRELKFVTPRLVVDADDWEQAWNEILPYSVWQKKFFAWQEEWGLDMADAVTVASRALEGLARKQRKKHAVFYVPNGGHALTNSNEHINLATVSSANLAEFNHDTDGPLILLYSRFMEFRLSRVVTLMQKVAHHLPKARWLIVGQGIHGEDKTLAEKVDRAGLSDRVQFMGWVAMSELSTYFHKADLAIYPYDNTWLNRTKCSVKLIDLMSAGVPVVADAIGQNCEYIQDAQSGLLVPPEDDEAFCEAIVRLAHDPILREKISNRAKQVIEERFVWSELVTVVEQAYAP
ncbi:glycosyltransferase family 4 protein [Anaerolineales bacterium HSG6]|nr:glycosyltransferase family 4 protein [Anaerolineales bacterium HSG6]